MAQTILVVDDEPEFLELVSWVLRAEGYDVDVASDGLQAVNKARTTIPSAIILDLMLPELDGTAVCEILRQTPSTSSIPILMVTGCATDACRWVALNAGVNEYVTKPCSPRELVSRINTAVRDRQTISKGSDLDDTLW